MQNKKDNYPWENLDTAMLFLPEELLIYHLYRYEQARKKDQLKEMKKEAQYINTYAEELGVKKVEEETCFQKR